jgi:hypothetical protein
MNCRNNSLKRETKRQPVSLMRDIIITTDIDNIIWCLPATDTDSSTPHILKNDSTASQRNLSSCRPHVHRRRYHATAAGFHSCTCSCSQASHEAVPHLRSLQTHSASTPKRARHTGSRTWAAWQASCSQCTRSRSAAAAPTFARIACCDIHSAHWWLHMDAATSHP